eukprot:gnl/MRDRNA2_/MRDRNA2_72938_c0_seq1.p1 gnl/MRDRNA2_/MRDRNA2_72938_c0~~gnl/MRDRNA2_/MRDRNA2_72938_c0_seq1.p1  ORF type:complete len:125 (+),score=16.16 gnl/MRDRNA2_/MRDRNA2_72938_c0_seq1:44-418(+)
MVVRITVPLSFMVFWTFAGSSSPMPDFIPRKASLQPVVPKTVSFHAQAGQDRWYMDKIWPLLTQKRRQHGFFVEFGARDGVEHSNTCHFERHRNWKGILLETVGHEYAPAGKLTIEENRPRSDI